MSKQDVGFPWYFAIDDRLVKVIATSSGGMEVLLFNPATGELERNMDYLSRCFEPGKDVQRLSEAEFKTKLAEQR
jgi:hypothetical protein